nr:LLM class flavin-dependent oxidoreductase [Flexivirga meconopsidis]
MLAITLIVHAPDPLDESAVTTRERFAQVVRSAELAESLGFDGFGVGERHERPFISSAPTVILSHLAARTRRIRLFTAVTTLSLLDPVRAYEDYATLDHLSDGRLELIIGKGNGTAQRDLFGVSAEDQWERNCESYEVFRALWRDQPVTAQTRFRPPLRDAEAWPRPLQQPIRIWHGSATSKESVDLAARYGDPLFSANVTNPIEPYAELVDHYRERWEHYGHDPARLTIGAGSAGLSVAPRSQDARAAFEPAFAAYLAMQRRIGVDPVFPTLDDYVRRSSALVGSPAEIVDKVGRYQARLGHSVLHVAAEGQGVPEDAHRRSLELFASEVAPALRRLPDPPSWAGVSADPRAAVCESHDTDAEQREERAALLGSE